MASSALYGQPPANDRDRAIVKGMMVWAGFPHGNPDKGVPLKPPAPIPKPMDSNGGSIIASIIVGWVVVTLITGTRIAAKVHSKYSRLGWDDWFIVFATFMYNVYLAVRLDMVINGGSGKHPYNITYNEMEHRMHDSGAVVILFFFVIVPAKLAIICFNARLTGLTSSLWIWTHRILFVAVCIYAAFFIPWFACTTRPTSAFYSYIAAGEHASTFGFRPDQTQSRYAYSILHVVLDWILIGIPVYMVMRLQMPLGTRLRCVVCLCVGCLSGIGAIYHVYLQLTHQSLMPYRDDIFVHWSFLDLTCVVIATSLPTVASLLNRSFRVPSSLARQRPSTRFSEASPTFELGEDTNPFSSPKAPDSSRLSKSTNRDKYDESGRMHADARKDIDEESSRASWEIHYHGQDTQGSQSHIPKDREMY